MRLLFAVLPFPRYRVRLAVTCCHELLVEWVFAVCSAWRECSQLHRGVVQAWGVRLFDPLSEVDRVMRLWAGIDDPDVTDRYTALNRWLRTPQDMPGRMFLWTVRHLFVNNELIKGELLVDGQIVELAAITCPIFLLAGRNDTAAPPAQVWALAERVSTPLEMIVREEANAGHLQRFLSNAVLQVYWFPIMTRVRQLSVRVLPRGESSAAAH
jgi:pimeloyl-ACP methyl ester carboxylesterase